MLKSFIITFLYFVQVYLTKNVSSEELSEVKIANIKGIAERLKNSINENGEPCVDYMDYICGRIDNTRMFSLSELVSQRLHETQMLEDVVTRFLPNSNMLEAEVKMANFLSSCQNISAHDPMNILKRYEFFHSIPNWPAFDQNWRIDELDFVTLLGEIRSLKFSLGVDMQFIKREGKRIIQISPEAPQGETSMEKTIWRINMLQQFGVEVAEKVVGDVEVFEKVYAKIFNTPNWVKNSKIETNFRRLKNIIPEFDWEKYFEIAAGIAPDDSFPVIIENIRGVKSAIATITNMNPRLVVNYVFYQFMFRTYSFIHHMNFKCYDFISLGFQKVITRLLANNYFSGVYNKYFFDAMNALIETLNDSLNIFESSNQDVEEKLDKVLFEVIFPSLTGESINKRYENLTIDPFDFLGNLFRVYREAIKDWLAKAIKTKTTKMEIVNDKFISYVLVGSLYEFTKKPAALLFDSIAGPVITEAANWIRTPEVTRKLNDSLSDCRLKQLDIFHTFFAGPEIIPVYGSQLYMDAYNKWAEKHKDIIKEEDEIFKEFGLSNKKILFAQMRYMALCTPETNFYPRIEIMEHLKRLSDFIDEFDCPERPLYNEIGNC